MEDDPRHGRRMDAEQSRMKVGKGIARKRRSGRAGTSTDDQVHGPKTETGINEVEGQNPAMWPEL